MSLETVRQAIEYERTETLLRTLQRVGQPITVKEAVKIVGTDGNTVNFQKHLSRIMEDDHRHGRAFYASFIIDAQSNLPNPEFFKRARALGYNIPDNNGAKKQFWLNQLQKMGVSGNIIRNFNQTNQNQKQNSNQRQNQNWNNDVNGKQTRSNNVNENQVRVKGNNLNSNQRNVNVSPNQNVTRKMKGNKNVMSTQTITRNKNKNRNQNVQMQSNQKSRSNTSRFRRSASVN